MQRHHVPRSRVQRVHEEHFSRKIFLTQCECASAPKHYQTELDLLLESHLSGLVEAWQGICRPTTPPPPHTWAARLCHVVATGHLCPVYKTHENPREQYLNRNAGTSTHAACVLRWHRVAEPKRRLHWRNVCVGTVRRQFLAV